MALFSNENDIHHDGRDWKWVEGGRCNDSRVLDQAHEFDGHYYGASAKTQEVVRVFPPRDDAWRDLYGRPRTCWLVTVHERDAMLPYRAEELSVLTSQAAALDLANIYLAELEEAYG